MELSCACNILDLQLGFVPLNHCFRVKIWFSVDDDFIACGWQVWAHQYWDTGSMKKKADVKWLICQDGASCKKEVTDIWLGQCSSTFDISQLNCWFWSLDFVFKFHPVISTIRKTTSALSLALKSVYPSVLEKPFNLYRLSISVYERRGWIIVFFIF